MQNFCAVFRTDSFMYKFDLIRIWQSTSKERNSCAAPDSTWIQCSLYITDGEGTHEHTVFSTSRGVFTRKGV